MTYVEHHTTVVPFPTKQFANSPVELSEADLDGATGGGVVAFIAVVVLVDLALIAFTAGVMDGYRG